MTHVVHMHLSSVLDCDLYGTFVVELCSVLQFMQYERIVARNLFQAMRHGRKMAAPELK